MGSKVLPKNEGISYFLTLINGSLYFLCLTFYSYLYYRNFGCTVLIIRPLKECETTSEYKLMLITNDQWGFVKYNLTFIYMYKKRI